jgi:myo-inositol 2-dehydrogenase/D-chiro-inositol 1-dehydrogenase
MSIGVGVIGAGVMGSDHARIVRSQVSGARLVAVADADVARAPAAAAGARVHADGRDLIADPEVEAVIVASPDHTHFDYAMAAIAAGKPVLCEKPLAPTVAECARIVAAEKATGRRLVHTGFMRRYDPTYRALRETVRSGTLGPVRVLHNRHRNQRAPDWFTADMAVTNSFVHEIDISRWLLGVEFTAVTVVGCRDATGGTDPMLITLETEGGALVSTEVFMNAGYGYHVDAEVVCARGAARMAEPALTAVRVDGRDSTAYPENWIPRFADAYRLQDQAWIDALHRGTLDDDAATSADGTMATYIAERAVEALRDGRRVPLETNPSPH